ncbi:MAG: hypothetical protein E6J12_08650 [Chloroflexi bacterium]|nr:MAG: hypothetical protein E6J12_08650 [Chloroflexota bacterium]
MRRSAGIFAVLALTMIAGACQLPGGRSSSHPAQSAAGKATCNRGTYRHIPGDFPEFGSTIFVGTTPDGIGSVYRVQAAAPNVTDFYMNGAGQLNYVFQLLGNSTDPAHLLWREQSDYNCRGTLDVKTDPADYDFTLYSAEPSDAAYAIPSSSP